MILKFSTKNIPYIEFDEDNRLIFAESTSTKEGYRWFVFSGVSTMSFAASGGKGKGKVKKTMTEPVSVILKIDLTGVPRDLKGCASLSSSNLNGLRKIIKPYIKNGILLRKNINELKKDINTDILQPDDYLNDDPNGLDDGEDDE